MSEYAIEIDQLCKKFGRHLVLDHITLSIAKGETIGLIGNNGSGKSVLLKCLCGLLRPSTGCIRINGKQFGREMEFAPEIGAVIEIPGFMPHRSGYANLKSLWALNRRVPLSKVRASMTLVGLDPENRKHVGRYSLGMRQRLGIAQALMEDSEILLLDEPFNGLDRQGLREMYALFNSLHDKGVTMLIASHNPIDIQELCSQVYEIDLGKIRKVDCRAFPIAPQQPAP